LDVGGKTDKMQATIKYFNKEKEKLSLVQVNTEQADSR
jgi:hypothetical protein